MPTKAPFNDFDKDNIFKDMIAAFVWTYKSDDIMWADNAATRKQNSVNILYDIIYTSATGSKTIFMIP